jgi:hypothetical protein
MKVKITKLKKAETALIGMRVPKQSYGNIGRITDAVMEQEGYALNYGKGPDIPKFGIEKKTKGSQSKSSYSIGSMTYDDIKKYPYDESPLKAKLQSEFIVKHDQIFMEITDAKIYDYSKDCIQEIVRYAYNSAREKLNKGANYVRGTGAWGYLEYKENSNSWVFRIPVHNMKKLMAMSSNNFDSLFEPA